MDEYRPRASKVLKGLIFLFLAALVLWYAVQCFPVINPFYDGNGYTRAEVTRLLENSNGVYQICARYRVGFKEMEGRYPAHIFYRDGLEVGDEINVPCRGVSFESMNNTEKKVLPLFLTVAGIFLTAGISSFVKEISAARYFRKLILNKRYVEAEFVKSAQKGGRICAVCAYDNHVFKSKYYKRDKYPFERGGKIRVYADIDKNPDKYLVSER